MIVYDERTAEERVRATIAETLARLRADHHSAQARAQAHAAAQAAAARAAASLGAAVAHYERLAAFLAPDASASCTLCRGDGCAVTCGVAPAG